MIYICKLCGNNEEDNELHTASTIHRFNYMLSAHNLNKDSLKGDRHGVSLLIKVKPLNGFEYDFTPTFDKRGRYFLNISPEKFKRHHHKIEFLCKIENRRTKKEDPIVITYAGVLHPYEPYSMSDPKQISKRHCFLELNNVNNDSVGPGNNYEFTVQLKLDEAHVSNYQIPIYFNIQTTNKNDEKLQDFSIARSIVVAIHDPLDQDETVHEKSPFTSNKWEKVTVIPPRKQLGRPPDQFPIPVKYKRCLWFNLKRDDGDGVLQEIQSKLIPGYVTLENYADFFHILLWLEETVAIIGLSCYNMENVTMEYKAGDILVLEVPGLAEKRPSVIVGDFIEIKIHGDHTAYRGVIRRVGDKTVDIHFVQLLIVNYIQDNPDTEMDVRFVLSRIHYERMHQGVEQTLANNFVQNLFPDESLAQKRIVEPIIIAANEFFNKTINTNTEQRTAVVKIVNDTSKGAPYIVYGPPGTGKTVTIVEAILQLKRLTNKKILVCAPANAACNMLTERLAPFCSVKELKRIMSQTVDIESINQDIKKFCNIEQDPNDVDVIIDIPKTQVSKYRIVVTTLVLAGKYTREYHPDVVFIDEAAQAREPEACCAIGLLMEEKQLILAGDPKQLGPVVHSETCKTYGLNVGILERLMTFEIYRNNTNFMTMLKLNFRSNSEVLRLPNELFYENQLKAVSPFALSDPIGKIFVYKKIVQNKRIPGHAQEFCSVLSKERREGRSPSYYNPREVLMVLKYVKALCSFSFDREEHRITPDQIGVVTPYIRQMCKIRDILRENYHDVEIGTTEAFQGREKRIMIISTVRAQEDLLLHDKKYNLGFVKEEKRFNVAITRAMSKVIVIGHPLLLSTDPKWHKYIKLCQQYGTFGGAPYTERNEKVRDDIVNRVAKVNLKDSQYRNENNDTNNNNGIPRRRR